MLSAPEIEELNDLTKHYYVMRDELKLVNEQVAELERAVNDLSARLTHLNDKNKQLNSRRSVILLAYFLEHFALYCLWFLRYAVNRTDVVFFPLITQTWFTVVFVTSGVIDLEKSETYLFYLTVLSTILNTTLCIRLSH